MAWYGHLILWVVVFGLGTSFGILYKGRKLRPIIAILKDSTLSADDKIKKIIALIV